MSPQTLRAVLRTVLSLIFVAVFMLRTTAARPAFYNSRLTSDASFNLSRLDATEPLSHIFRGRIAFGALIKRTPGLLIQFGTATALCSASVLDRRHILTSAHCVFDESGRRASSATVVSFASGSRQFYRVTRACMLASFRTRQAAGADLALLRVERRMAGVMAFAIPRVRARPGSWMSAAGFGENGRNAQNPLLWDRVYVRAGAAPYRNAPAVITTVRHPSAPRGSGVVCVGDSGGPLYKWNGKWLVLHGVNSQAQFISSGGYRCGQEDTIHFHTSVAHHRAKILACTVGKCHGWQCWTF